jgi:hypothetical protein
MNGMVRDFTTTELALAHTCGCGTEFTIQAGKTLGKSPDEATCNICRAQLGKLGGVLSAYQKLCEQIQLLEKPEEGHPPAKLRLRAVLPDVQVLGLPKVF